MSRSPRYPVHFTAVCDDGDRYLTAPVTNLSGSGLFIETPTPVSEGTNVHIVPLLPPSRGLPEFQGVVVRVQEQEGQPLSALGKPAGLGVAFVSLREQDATQLTQYCEELQRERMDEDVGEAAASPSLATRSERNTPEPVVGYQGLALRSQEGEASEAGAVEAGAAQPRPMAPPTQSATTSQVTAVQASPPPGDVVTEQTQQKKRHSETQITVARSDEEQVRGPEKHHAERGYPADTSTSLLAKDEQAAHADDELPLLEDGEAELVDDETLSSTSGSIPLASDTVRKSDPSTPHLLTQRKGSHEERNKPQTDRSSLTDRKVAEPDRSAHPEASSREEQGVSQSRAPAALERSEYTQAAGGQQTDAGDDPLLTLLSPPGRGAALVIGVLNLVALACATACIVYKFDVAEQRQGNAEVRLNRLAQDVGFVSERTKTLLRGQDSQGEVLEAVGGAVVTRPSLSQSIAAVPAGVSGRWMVQTSAKVTNPQPDDAEVAYVLRRILLGESKATSLKTARTQGINGTKEKGAVRWTVIEQEQGLAGGDRLKTFTSLTRQQRKRLGRRAQSHDLIGTLEAGERRYAERAFLIDIPQGGLIRVETEIGLVIDGEPTTLSHVETTGVGATDTRAPPARR